MLFLYSLSNGAGDCICGKSQIALKSLSGISTCADWQTEIMPYFKQLFQRTIVNLSVLKIILFCALAYFAQDPARVPNCGHIGGNVLRHNTSRSNDHIVSNRNTRQHNDSCAKPVSIILSPFLLIKGSPAYTDAGLPLVFLSGKERFSPVHRQNKLSS